MYLVLEKEHHNSEIKMASENRQLTIREDAGNVDDFLWCFGNETRGSKVGQKQIVIITITSSSVFTRFGFFMLPKLSRPIKGKHLSNVCANFSHMSWRRHIQILSTCFPSYSGGATTCISRWRRHIQILRMCYASYSDGDATSHTFYGHRCNTLPVVCMFFRVETPHTFFGEDATYKYTYTHDSIFRL